MTRQTNHADVVCQILAAKLCTQTDFVGFLQEFLFQIYIAEGTACLVASGGQRIVVFDRGKFHRQQILFSRCATNHESDVIRRTSRCAEALHLLHEEGEQSALVLDGCLRHGVEVGLVGRAATLCHHHETVFSTFSCLDVNLGRKVAFRVHLVIHVQRCVLRITQIVLSEGVEHTLRQCLFVFKTCPHLLALLTVNDSRTRVLAEGEYALGSRLSVAQELQSHILVILRCFRVAKNLRHLQVVLTAQHELHIVECLLSQQRECLW